ncbi:MAG: polymer-forming cytoskeletal protein [Acidobacteria bacterium]|nr:polymer-forming cytoskeletal protein [Acidobacteriota bacterium]
MPAPDLPVEAPDAADVDAAATSILSASLVITGAISAEEDLEIHGTIRGHVAAPGHCIRIMRGALVDADVLARDLVIDGHAQGKMTGTEIIDVHAGATVSGQLAAPRFVLAEGGSVQARVETRRVDAAVRVAQYRKER